MVIAIAALLFQIAPVAGTLATPDEPATSAQAIFATNLPDTSISIASIATVSVVSTVQPQPGNAAEKIGGPSPSSVAPASSEPANITMEHSELLSMIRVPNKSDNEHRLISPEALPSRRRWIALSIAQHAAAAFDAYTTRAAISRGAVEEDPLMRPFADSSAMYAAIQVSPVLLDLAARKMQRSQNNFLRHAWWLPQSVSTGMFLFSGAHNLQVSGTR
jgi:hypothetical protein